MNKKITFSLFIVLAFSLALVSSLENTICCEETNSGAFCQNVPESQCKTSASQESCEQTSFCQLGTCVSSSTGECSANTPKKVCEQENGQWYAEDVDSIQQCKRGCCQVGDQAAFVSNVECKRIATDYGVDIRFRSDISDEASCLLLSEPEETGACTFISEGARRCSMETKQVCSNKNGEWFDGLLCTAGNLSDCAPTENKVCNEDDIYFLDSCGNLANVYDVTMFAKKGESWTQEMNEYWEKKMSPTCRVNSAGCGDCNYAQGSVCSEDRNNFFCKDLSCRYDTNNDGKITNDENYKHGESWCAESEGTYHHITVNPFNMEYKSTKIVEELRKGYEEYNLPGSRYYKLTCWEGEVIPEPCADYRNEICKEGTIDNEETGESFRLAQCRTNAWRACFDILDKETCESPVIDCKWVYGYRLDGQIVPEELRENEQGTCVPLYAPGFDFWTEDSSGKAICEIGTVREAVMYETGAFLGSGDREDIESSLSESAERCFEGCYAIPQYADKNSPAFMEALHKGDRKISDGNTISERKGYYCEGGTGSETGEVNCGFSIGGLKDLDFKPLPIFLRNQDWLASITERAKSLGDCGYKENMIGTEGEYSSEIITRIFQELKQDESVDVNHTAIISYEGNDWTGRDARSPKPGVSN